VTDVHEFVDVSFDFQHQVFLRRIVGQDLDAFAQFFVAVALGVDLDGDFSLAAGGDLPRKGGGCAPSAGLDLVDDQLGITLVLDDKVVDDLFTVEDRFKLEDRLQGDSKRRIGRPVRGSETGRGNHEDDADGYANALQFHFGTPCFRAVMI
jgi:hypothetical protein